MNAEAFVSLSALKENYRLFEARVKGERTNGKLWCVVKSNAYGHGLLPCAKALYTAGARHFCVAKAEEGLTLKAYLPNTEVLVLGKTDIKDRDTLAAFGILQTVHSLAYAKTLSGGDTTPLAIHIKIDIGMGRMGIGTACVTDAVQEILAISRLPNIQIKGVFAHLPEADMLNSAKTPTQIEKFHRIVGALRSEGLVFDTHLCATAGLLRFGLAGCEGARAGIGLYGISPSPAIGCPSLRPALSLSCPLLQVKMLGAGESVGYGGAWRTPAPGSIGVIPFGYADGLPRLCEGGKVFVFGRKVPLAGRISMDYATLWLGSLPAEEGDTVTVYDKKGKNLLALAKQAQTIPYELLVALSLRVKRTYMT